MSGVFSGISGTVRRIASSGFLSKTRNAANIIPTILDPISGAQRYTAHNLLKKRGYTDTKILEKNPTTPMSESDSATKFNDPLNLTGEPGRDSSINASEEEAARIAALPPPRPIPDEEELRRVRRRTSARRGQHGRASTILSDSAYSSDTLG